MYIFVSILLLALCILIYVLIQQIRQHRKHRLKLDRSLDRELLTLLGGDKQIALRLLRNARKNNPGRSYLWYHEKVILDLERDRRY